MNPDQERQMSVLIWTKTVFNINMPFYSSYTRQHRNFCRQFGSRSGLRKVGSDLDLNLAKSKHPTVSPFKTMIMTAFPAGNFFEQFGNSS